MGNIIGCCILSILAIGSFVISYRQFREKGFLFNNAYIYASKQERETMNKTPHYKQSGVVFLLIGIILLINAANIILHLHWLLYCEIAVIVLTVVYASISSMMIDK